MSVSISLDTSGLDSLIDDLGESITEAARPAAQAGAQVLYDEVKRNVASIGRVTGNLDRSIYQAYSEKKSSGGVPTYAVSWRTGYSKDESSKANATGKNVAPHGHLIEFGYVQRYASYIGKDGKWHTAVRPEKQGTKPPKRRASQAEKDAYYVPRPGGPVQWMPRSFIRKAANKFPQALAAAEEELLKRINKG